MNVGDASAQIVCLYQQAEALTGLAHLDPRKYDAQLVACLIELRDAVHALENPDGMLTLIRTLTRLPSSSR